ncbi:hypothetical protein PSECIP111854_04155 [Pseudoalteromonas sp. CIP111854]|uniref:Uncharacterized protein n=1 Tax=Pseudoalteromonas holothuriae TaxID=2963714 RepID=A0A9W4R5V0_9GAMM|nr:hypothetical protein [Pseudoalteromonas sp. CIP111854]CAH9067623.1 hypothetical protein PSECIP111854_04155 [Pseudoalteromonas sp. CIP111854]
MHIRNPKYLSFVFVILVFASVLFRDVFSYSESEDINSYVEPQVDISLMIAGINGLKVERMFEELLTEMEFQLSSSVTNSPQGKRWAEKGMIKSLWNNDDKYVDLSNLLNTNCFNIRIYTSSVDESKDIERKLVKRVAEAYPEYIRYSNLQCR